MTASETDPPSETHLPYAPIQVGPPEVRRSRFAGIRPLYAWLLLGLVVGLSVYGVLIHARTKTLTYKPPGASLDRTDFALYERIVNRVHGGEGYYQAAGA